MRTLKRLLLFTCELAVFPCGFVISFAIGDYFDSGVIFLLGVSMSIAWLFMFRRMTGRWKIGYEAIGFALSRAERRLHPTRAKYKRMIGRILIWVPTLIAALVLFFFPIASHLVHPSSRYLSHYRVPIPWNFIVFSPLEFSEEYGWVEAFGSSDGPARFGVTPFGNNRPYSLMSFGANRTVAAGSEVTAKLRERATQIPSKEFRLGDVALSCWQRVPPSSRGYWTGPFELRNFTGHFWKIDCEAPADVHRQSFHASFQGREEDIPAFYKVLEGVTAVE